MHVLWFFKHVIDLYLYVYLKVDDFGSREDIDKENEPAVRQYPHLF